MDCGEFVLGATITDRFWAALRQTVRAEGIPYQWEALNDQIPDAVPSRCMRNFRIAAGRETGEHGGYVFQDSDVAKWLEGVAFSLRSQPDTALEALADGAIGEIVAAQQPDGYLDTYYIITGLDRRLTNLKDNHELYCAGHMLEAAVAYFQATGKRVLLDAMIRYVDYIDARLGPEPDKKHGYPGHPVLEMALMRLYDVTCDPKHLALAAYFVNQRGQSPLYFEEEDCENGNEFTWKDSPFRYQYYQAGKPLREQTEAEGHAVRAVYLYSGMADVARETNDEGLKAACLRMWDSITRRRMYVTGGIGSSEHGEAFTFDYDLPNDTVYGETCASIGLVFFARRMLRLQAKGEYADVMERALYNGIISGMQLDGKRFFYVNPLEALPIASRKDHYKRHVKCQRQKWFPCSCCPPNLIRLLMSLDEYAYSVSDDTLFAHLYIQGGASARVGGARVDFSVETRYPWDGRVTVKLAPEAESEFALALRVPGWCRDASIRVNGETASAEVADGYAYIRRAWRAGDVVTLDLPMPVRLVRANPLVREDIGKVAVARGPIVYCMEEADNGANLHLLRLGGAKPADFKALWEEETLGGIVSLTAPGLREREDGWDGALYADRGEPEADPATLRWIPYYRWANRGEGEMRVWIRE